MKLILKRIGTSFEISVEGTDYPDSDGTVRIITYSPFSDPRHNFIIPVPQDDHYPIFVKEYDESSPKSRWIYSGYTGHQSDVEDLAYKVSLQQLDRLKARFANAEIEDRVMRLEEELSATSPKPDPSRQPWVRPSKDLSPKP